MSSRSRNTTDGAERAPKSKSKSPADAATSNGAQGKPGKASKAKRNPAFARLHLNIPAKLRARRQWVCAADSGRPINPHTGGNAMSNKPATWGTFEEAEEACVKYGHPHVAFAITADDPYCIVDLDDKPENPASKEERKRFDFIIEGLDSYTERSKSGRGFHVVVEADVENLKSSHVEIYSRDHFMTFTGDVVGKVKPIRKQTERIASIANRLRRAKAVSNLALATADLEAEEPDEDVIARASEAPTTGAKFNALLRGDWEDLEIGDGSQSAADLAFVGMVWDACGNAAQVERIWLASRLAERDKGQRPDYIARMLDKVMQSPPKMLRDDSPASMFSDTANARRIEYHMGADLLYVPGIGWHVWDSARWRPDSLEARRLVGKLGRIVLTEAGAMLDRAARTSDRTQAEKLQDLAEKLLKFSGTVENVAKIDAAMKAAEPLLRCDADQLDADPYLLGCTNGVVDLRTGELLPASSDQLISKSTGQPFDLAAKAPGWLAFLKRIFRKHPELPAFVQRLAGYWLTGLTDPPYLSVLYGVGANGKSTLVKALSHAMGEYASAAPPGLLMARYGERHPTELAALQGKRFVAAAESGEGGRLDEERIKSLTGSDRITARRMREDFYSFQPTHNFALMTNHKPIVRGVDEGIWRRLLLLPFDEVIPKAEQDLNFAEKLKDEAPGILAWAVEGARVFLEDGALALPPIVAEATATYRTESDVLGGFVAEECDVDARASILSSQLYATYERWCDDSGERPLPKRTLGLRLQERGFAPAKDAKGQRLWKGLRLRDTPKLKFR